MENNMEKEIRSVGEIRGTDDEGILEAYLTKWDSVDSYHSTFERGSFKDTFEKRGGKIKLLWDHSTLIGKVLECSERSYGPWVKAQINLNTTAGKEAYAHLRAGDVDAMSFGFNVLKDRMDKDLRVISEVRCLEVSPVIFPANEQAAIVSVRDKQEPVELPEGWGDNSLTRELFEHCKGDLPAVAQETSFTMDELKTLSEGRCLHLSKRHKLVELPEAIQEAHQDERRKAVELLCSELLAGGFDETEMKQIGELLENKESSDISATMSSIRELRKTLTDKEN